MTAKRANPDIRLLAGDLFVDGHLYKPSRWVQVCSRWLKGEDSPTDMFVVEYTSAGTFTVDTFDLVAGKKRGRMMFGGFDEALEEATQIAAHEAFVGGFQWDFAAVERIPAEDHALWDLSLADLTQIHVEPDSDTFE